MQLNDVIKSIGWYQAFVALPIQTDTTKNSTDTDTSASLTYMQPYGNLMKLSYIAKTN